MKKLMYWLSSVVLAGWTLSVHAQDIWAYQVIGSNNQPTITFQPPRDLTYPPAGMPMPIAEVGERRGVVITPQEATARLRAPQLIIMLIPAQIADRRRYGNSR
ncbi:MAG TPA: hypothetical protein VGQ88_04240 [Burkholderiales bacterium]|nr:hypothetical protein [Burkholderiales bacterium]